MTIENHPLEPFLPTNAKILFLGSFPPPKARWCMEFFYPNWINDFWRIQGIIHFGDKRHFEITSQKRFDKDRIVCFCLDRGYAFFDTATKVCRKKDNASDEFLDILEPTDVAALVDKLPECKVIVTTGGKASTELAAMAGGCPVPKPGEHIDITLGSHSIQWWRMPSSSRAYPMSIENKANLYRLLPCL